MPFKSLWKYLLHQYHESPSGWHIGSDKTGKTIGTKYYWHIMRKKTFTCLLCVSNQRRPEKTQDLIRKKCEWIFQWNVLQWMLWGHFKNLDEGMCYILVVHDCFSKWLEDDKIPSKESETNASKLSEEWITRHRAPRELHGDQGSHFESI